MHTLLPAAFAPSVTQIDCRGLVEGSATQRESALENIAQDAAGTMHSIGFVVFRIGRLRLSADDSREVAEQVARRLRKVLVELGAPRDMRLEIDKPQETVVPSGFPTRTLLPHHDGQHCSYLTPSIDDVPTWDPSWREFGSTGYTTTPAHKMYQGIFLADAGQGLSATPYYDWLGILGDVFDRRDGRAPGNRTMALAAWLGENLRRAIESQPVHGCPYPSFGAFLGLVEPLWNGLSFHHAEARLPGKERLRFPEAIPLSERCACGLCNGEMARLFCNQVLMGTGLTWSEFRNKWEILAPGDQCDLLFGHNLTMLHGGLAGGTSRVLEPLCLVVDSPMGSEYERWLAASWRRMLPGEHE